MRIADGDEQAFANLFNRYYHEMFQYIFRITNSLMLTEEIVQDVFLKYDRFYMLAILRKDNRFL